MKIRRSRSSRTALLLGSVRLVGARAAARPRRGGRRARPRGAARSIARLRAVVMIHAGRARRHARRRPALRRDAKASWTASSASVDVAEDADQDRHRAAVLLAEDALDLRAERTGTRASVLVAWNGRTSTGSVVARASLRAQASAASRSGASMIVKPPMCSLPSTKGPSVTSTSSPCGRSTVAVLARVQPAREDPGAGGAHLLVERATSRMIRSRSTEAGGGPSAWYMASR